MREVKFVKGLIVERAHFVSETEVVEYRMGMEPLARINPAADFYLRTEAKVERRVVPVHEIRGGEEGDLFIAYSEEVQMLLKMPFDALREENKILREALADSNGKFCDYAETVRNARWWRRLKYLFVGSFNSLL